MTSPEQARSRLLAVQAMRGGREPGRPPLLALLVYGPAGRPAEVVVPFVSETDALAWAREYEVSRWQLVPARLTGSLGR